MMQTLAEQVTTDHGDGDGSGPILDALAIYCREVKRCAGEHSPVAQRLVAVLLERAWQNLESALRARMEK